MVKRVFVKFEGKKTELVTVLPESGKWVKLLYLSYLTKVKLFGI